MGVIQSSSTSSFVFRVCTKTTETKQNTIQNSRNHYNTIEAASRAKKVIIPLYDGMKTSCNMNPRVTKSKENTNRTPPSSMVCNAETVPRPSQPILRTMLLESGQTPPRRRQRVQRPYFEVGKSHGYYQIFVNDEFRSPVSHQAVPICYVGSVRVLACNLSVSCSIKPGAPGAELRATEQKSAFCDALPKPTCATPV